MIASSSVRRLADVEPRRFMRTKVEKGGNHPLTRE
jgi:hypothetical protein